MPHPLLENNRNNYAPPFPKVPPIGAATTGSAGIPTGVFSSRLGAVSRSTNICPARSEVSQSVDLALQRDRAGLATPTKLRSGTMRSRTASTTLYGRSTAAPQVRNPQSLIVLIATQPARHPIQAGTYSFKTIRVCVNNGSTLSFEKTPRIPMSLLAASAAVKCAVSIKIGISGLVLCSARAVSTPFITGIE
jgi:hypothetical protein